MSVNKEFIERITNVKPIEFPNNVTGKANVSVCVQTYQHAEYINECLDGILMQKVNFNFEILLGEDNSDDGTREICIEYAKKYPGIIKLTLHHRENVLNIEGTPTGRYNLIYNLYKAKGKYIAIVEGDDYWIDEYKLQKQYDFLENNNKYSGCFHDTFIKKEELSLFRKYSKNTFNLNDTVNNLSLFHTSSFFFRNITFNFQQCFLKIASADMAIFSMVANRGELYRIPNVMSVYRITNAGVTAVEYRITKHHQIIIKLWECLLEHLGKKNKELFNNQIKYHQVEILKHKKQNKIFPKIIYKIKQVIKCLIKVV